MLYVDFCNTTLSIENGSIRKIEHTNLTYIEPHRIKIKLSELEQYIKES